MFADWKYFVAWSAFIFSLTPFGRSLQLELRDRFGSEVLFFGFLLVIVIVAILVWARFQDYFRSVKSFAMLAFFTSAFVAITYSRRENPEEAFHLWEYGLLSLFAVRAIGGKRPDFMALLAAALLTACVGACEELYQWILPSRYFDFRDIWLNTEAALLFQMGLAAVLYREGFLQQVTGRSIDFFVRTGFLAASLAVSISFLTPKNVDSLVEKFPLFSSLANEHVIDFGYLHHFQERVSFRSHFSEAELKALNESRGDQVRGLLESEDRSVREAFLAKYSELRDPYVNEAEVHLFRRDASLARLQIEPNDAEAEKSLLGEAEILGNYFPNASRNWPLAKTARLRLTKRVPQTTEYESPVEKDLVTQFSARQIQLASIAVLLFFAGQIIRRRKNDS